MAWWLTLTLPVTLPLSLSLSLPRYGVVAAFAPASCDRYETLQLSNAFISDRLAACMAEALRTNAALTSLNLESNSISSVGLEAFAYPYPHPYPTSTPTPTPFPTFIPTPFPFPTPTPTPTPTQVGLEAIAEALRTNTVLTEIWGRYREI